MTKTTKTTQTAKKRGVECWIRGNDGNHENDENHGKPGCKPQVPKTTGLEIPENSPQKIGVWWVARLKVSISLENFKILNFFNLWALRASMEGIGGLEAQERYFSEQNRELRTARFRESRA